MRRRRCLTAPELSVIVPALAAPPPAAPPPPPNTQTARVWPLRTAAKSRGAAPPWRNQCQAAGNTAGDGLSPGSPRGFEVVLCQAGLPGGFGIPDGVAAVAAIAVVPRPRHPGGSAANRASATQGTSASTATVPTRGAAAGAGQNVVEAKEVVRRLMLGSEEELSRVRIEAKERQLAPLRALLHGHAAAADEPPPLKGSAGPGCTMTVPPPCAAVPAAVGAALAAGNAACRESALAVTLAGAARSPPHPDGWGCLQFEPSTAAALLESVQAVPAPIGAGCSAEAAVLAVAATQQALRTTFIDAATTAAATAVPAARGAMETAVAVTAGASAATAEAEAAAAAAAAAATAATAAAAAAAAAAVASSAVATAADAVAAAVKGAAPAAAAAAAAAVAWVARAMTQTHGGHGVGAQCRRGHRHNGGQHAVSPRL
eukprot:NODE_3088_length_2094_cov_9.190646.p1 GENE.NODE_3088_length_2094_cov_9.190646~~NODE_3088_length_2094_cov_9.190646.p1  ORF type:complete len:430 (-),score=93.04 NODE_3088_length_2094_cov_9.190646:497-1786(-)